MTPLLLAFALGCREEPVDSSPPADPGPVEVYADDAPAAEVRDVPVGVDGVSLPRPAFDAEGLRFVWQDPEGVELWVGAFDASTGNLIPDDGRGELVDAGVGSLAGRGHGPRWVSTAGGAQVVYSRGEGTEAVLYRAERRGGIWASSPVDGTAGRVGGIGSTDPQDTAPRIAFTDLIDGGLHWSYLDGREDTRLTDALDTLPRWIPGRLGLVWSEQVDGTGQVHQFLDGDTRILTNGLVPLVDPWIWPAPETGGDLMVAIRSSGEAIDVLAEVDDRWSVVKTIHPPSTAPWVAEVEPFVAEGGSWVVFVASTGPEHPTGGASAVWLAGLAPGSDVIRRVGEEGAIATDPQPVVVGDKAWVFYSRREGDQAPLRRAELW